MQPAKRKMETSYDINNIVIPMSMASATRLEDTSDEMYLTCHQKFEELERARWDSWTGTSSQRRGN
ncbi:hypothetical protein E2320_022764, partial [Naja naja]